MSNDAPLTLRDVAQAALTSNGGVPGRELERIASKRGLTIAATTINHIAAGTYKSRPSRKTLSALAELSPYSLEQVYEAAGQPMPLRPLSEDLPPDADLLTGSQRRVVIDTVRLFAQQNRELATLRAASEQEGGGERADRSAPTTRAGDKTRDNVTPLSDRSSTVKDPEPRRVAKKRPDRKPRG